MVLVGGVLVMKNLFSHHQHGECLKPVDIIATISLKHSSPTKRAEAFFHKSHLADPTRLSRLLIAACLAYIWMITQGFFVIAKGKLSLIDRTDRRDKSLFRLGLDWLKYALNIPLIFSPHFTRIQVQRETMKFDLKANKSCREKNYTSIFF
ncbi:hypothetical protein [Candidatus Villigracilis saccharophilus]|uniref:hypothetical protein n=1 Tax=Candidatus Villigracilis saccharophilus TaxID=3140684 RepID=UPI003134AFD4|nr:hypothetical protein [Anaerolineales bacterium]